MKAGALDFIEKPVSGRALIESIDQAYDLSRNAPRRQELRDEAIARLAQLTRRERDILKHVLAGHPSKVIAFELGISQRTVEGHRAAIMQKSGSKSSAELTRLALLAADEGT